MRNSKERDRILAQYTNLVETFNDVEELVNDEAVEWYEKNYNKAFDQDLADWMRKAKERKIAFLEKMSCKRS